MRPTPASRRGSWLECGLAPTSVAEVTGVHGTQLSNVYLIDVYLPNHVVAEGVEAVESPALAGELDDVLIGMDIIGVGDFAVSNFQGKTTFTFRIPSLAEIDFGPSPPKVGRNDPCPCGSGKKYKEVPRVVTAQKVTAPRSSPATARPPGRRPGRSRGPADGVQVLPDRRRHWDADGDVLDPSLERPGELQPHRRRHQHALDPLRP